MMKGLHRAGKIWKKLDRASPYGSRLASTLGTNLFMGAMALLTGTLAARLLGPEGRGELAAIQIWPNFIATFAMLGLPEALVYFSAREPTYAGRFWGSATTFSLLMALPFMAVGYFLMPIFLAAQNPEVISLARWYLLLIPIRALVGMSLNPLRGLNDFLTWNILRIMPTIGWLAVLSLAWIFSQARASFVAVGHLIMLAVLFFPFFYIVTRRVPDSFSPAASSWKPMLRYGISSGMVSVPQTLNLRLDQMLMAALLPTRSLGIYVVAVAWSNITNPLLSAVGTVLFPRVASEKSPNQQISALAAGTRLGALSSLILLLPLLVATPWVIPFMFGSAFSSAIPAALVLIVAASILGMNRILQEGLRGMGHPMVVLASEFAGLIVTAGSLFLLLRPLEIMGAAIASLLGYSTISLYLIIRTGRLTGLSPVQLIVPSSKEVFSLWQRTRMLLAEVMAK